MITQIFLADLWMAVGAYEQSSRSMSSLTMVQTIHTLLETLYTSQGIWCNTCA
ncbi:MAG: hypothetical protein R3E79_51980 [Caldilineaceae bacterium]